MILISFEFNSTSHIFIQLICWHEVITNHLSEGNSIDEIFSARIVSIDNKTRWLNYISCDRKSSIYLGFIDKILNNCDWEIYSDGRNNWQKGFMSPGHASLIYMVLSITKSNLALLYVFMSK